MSEVTIKSLPLEKLHVALGARFQPFAGWNMPVRYESSITEEHQAVRNAVGFFDVSHMGQLFVSGSKAQEFLEYLFSNKVSSLKIGRARYGFFLNQYAGVIDDVIIYHLGENDYFLCVNASNTEAVCEHLHKELEKKSYDTSEICFVNSSDTYAQFAVQGPKAKEVLEKVFNEYSALSFFGCTKVEAYSVPALPCILARTGYTGEDGAEVFIPKQKAEEVWKLLFSKAEEVGTPLRPCGLAARDTLRLEASLPLHGHELRIDQTPLNGGLGRFVDFNKGPFIGNQAMEHQMSLAVTPRLVGLKILGKGVVREEETVTSAGKTVGWTTSGTKTPCFDYPIAMAYVLSECTKEGTSLEVLVRGRSIEVEVVALPFYKRK